MNNKESLKDQKCIPCSIDTLPIQGNELREIMEDLKSGWELVKDIQIEKVFNFKDFKEALDFVNKVGAIAEEDGHHPDIELGWGRVKVKLMTHKIHGLSMNDFILAAKIDDID
ncbi:4a-hydroxytetrahydrobiopterin dehydratase [Acetoanaerobium pronyense]|uniref:Putative pterin-4-alpha-carbinolamine dehydratase n=1 Tax=Acetoanaerobium pronyense TaxID=1482736 RepID=A0ABS4KNC3_9FIRM|nr:4a-hydroxytetrahydrobiopterin dehydratase [Acetoanaerobium pronyense]